MLNLSKNKATFVIIFACALILATDSLFGRYISLSVHQSPLVTSGIGYFGATLFIITISWIGMKLAHIKPPEAIPVITDKYAILYGVIHILQVATILFQLSLMSAFEATLVARLSIGLMVIHALFTNKPKSLLVNILGVLLIAIIFGMLLLFVVPENITKAMVTTTIMAILWLARGYAASKAPRQKDFLPQVYSLGWTQFSGSILFLVALVILGSTSLGQSMNLGISTVMNGFTEDFWKLISFGIFILWPLLLASMLWTPQRVSPDIFQLALALLPILVLVLEQISVVAGLIPPSPHSWTQIAGSAAILIISLTILIRG